MVRIFALLIAALLLPGPRPAAARGASFKAAINSEVSKTRQIAPQLGVSIVDVESGDAVYSFNPDQLRVLASNTKLFTSAAALDQLGPGYFFETPVLMRGTVASDGLLLGDLAVVGGGDPNISGRFYAGDSFAVFRDWAAELRRRGVRRIAGDLVLATGLFDDQTVHPDWPKDQLDRWYEAPVAALSFNDNCVLVSAEPSGNGSKSARLSVRPPVGIFPLDGQVLLTSNRAKQWLSVSRATTAADPLARQRIKVSGRLHRNAETLDKWVTVPDPTAYFAAGLRRGLAEEGIEIEGDTRIVEHLQDGEWRPVTTHRTGLIDTLEIINKRSQNYYSENLIKVLGARHCGRGDWPSGVRAVSELITKAGIPEGDYQLADGSGMSRNNRFTPAQVTHLLRYMFYHRWGQEFVRTLPFSGETDLKWQKRLAQPPYRGNVLAKTGTLNGVSTLSGYAKATSGKIYAFSILCNASSANWRAKKAQDSILRALIDQG